MAEEILPPSFTPGIAAAKKLLLVAITHAKETTLGDMAGKAQSYRIDMNGKIVICQKLGITISHGEGNEARVIGVIPRDKYYDQYFALAESYIQDSTSPPQQKQFALDALRNKRFPITSGHSILQNPEPGENYGFIRTGMIEIQDAYDDQWIKIPEAGRLPAPEPAKEKPHARPNGKKYPIRVICDTSDNATHHGLPINISGNKPSLS